MWAWQHPQFRRCGTGSGFRVGRGTRVDSLHLSGSHPGHSGSVRTLVHWTGSGLMARMGESVECGVVSGPTEPILPVCLQDSVLAFWSHGMQGRSLDTNEVSEAQRPDHLQLREPCLERTCQDDLRVPCLLGDPGDHR